MHRGSAVFRGALLMMVIAAGFQLAAANIGGTATITFPGQVSVSPQQVDAGATGINLTFSYTRGDQLLTGGKLSVKIPPGWTQPQSSARTSPGFVEASLGKVDIANRLITVKNLTLCKSCSMVLSYLDVTAPSALGSATFVAKAAKAGQAFEKVNPAPSVMVNSTQGTTTTTSTTTTTTPCGEPVTSSSNGVTMTVTPGTCLAGGTLVTLTGSGFDPNSSGLISQCNNDPSQPTVTINIVGNSETLPVSCIPLVITRVITTNANGDIPPGKTYSVIAGTTGPPCGPGSLAPTCPVDSSGGNPVVDATQYPCPPTPAQLAQGVSCTLSFGDSVGKSQTVDLTFGTS